MSSFVKALDAEIADLERELEANPTFMKLREAKRLRAVYAGVGVTTNTSARQTNLVVRAPTSGAGSAILISARRLLDGRSAPTPTREIMDYFSSEGVEVGGANPQNVVSSMLSKSPDFISHGRSGWTLAVSTGDETEKADDANPSWDTSSALIEGRTSHPVYTPAQGREAGPGGGT